MVKPDKRQIVKTVSFNVDVEVFPSDLLRALTPHELRAECSRRGIELRGENRGNRHKISSDEIQALLEDFRRRDLREFLSHLEWALPRDFRGLADLMPK